MKRSGYGGLTGWVGWIALACTVALSCSSGGGDEDKTQLSGSVALPSPNGALVGQGGVKVTLLDGDLREMFRIVYKTTPEARARRALIASLEGTRRRKLATYERARAALSALDLPANGSDINCESAVEAKRANADAQLLAYLHSAQQRLDQLGLPITDVSTTLRALEEKAQREEASELRSLVEEYKNLHLTLQPSVLFDGRGAAWDRLCWRISNDGHLNLARASLSIVYNGRRLPIETARLLWQVPGDALVLSFEDRDANGGTVFGLAAGATAKGCVFAADRSNLTEHRELLESQGLGNIVSLRSGAWGLVFDSISLTRTPRVETTDRETSASYRFFPPQALESVFAPELSARRSTFRARALLEDIHKSPPGIAREQTQKASRACRAVVDLKSTLTSLDENLAGLHTWADVAPAMEARVTVVLEEMGETEQDPTNAEDTLAGLIAERHAAVATTDDDGAFEFTDLKPDTYTVLVRHEKNDFAWIEVVHLVGSANVELRRENAMNGALARALAQLD